MKIYITGSSGSGTTTLGNKLSEKLNILKEDTDTFFWEPTNPPFTLQRDIKDLHKVFNEFVAKDSFILSGDCLNWGLFLAP
jgi:adenylate kinase family enzyme